MLPGAIHRDEVCVSFVVTLSFLDRPATTGKRSRSEKAPCPLAMGYYIHQLPASDPPAAVPDYVHWGAELESGTAQQRRLALRRLVAASAEDVLTQCLASPDPVVVQLAASGLWECWLNEAGESARREMETGIDAINDGDLTQAFSTFSALTDHHPAWAEALNKLATVLYLQNKPEASIVLCRQVVALKPDHFGAWNGLTLCAVQIEDWPLARRAVNESLRLQPHSAANRQLLQLVESRLAGQ